MISLKYKQILEQMENNLKKEGVIVVNESVDGSSDNNTSTAGGQFAPLALPLIKKLYLDSLIVQIADVQPLTAPVGKVSAMYATYSGEGSSAETNLHPDNSFLIEFASTNGMHVGDILTHGSVLEPVEGGGEIEVGTVTTFKIHYIEDTKILISLESGAHVPVKDDVLLDAARANHTVTYATYNRAAIKKLFKGYAGAGKNNEGYFVGYNYGYDNNTNIKYVGFESRTVNAVTASRKLKSKFSWEQLEDLQHVYKENGIEIAGQYLGNEVRQEIDKEFIQYLKFISKFTTSATLNLNNSLGTPHGALADITGDLIANIYLAAEQIVKDTKRNRTIFILADPVTTSFLQTNAFHTVAAADENNPYRIGQVGTYPLFCDLYAEPGEHYILVGYLGSNNNDGDTGVIYSPYTTTMHVVPSAGDMKENLLYLDRYAMTRHPQDLGNVDPNNPWSSVNGNNSDFFKMFAIDFGAGGPNGLANYADTSLPLFNQ